MCPAGDWCNFDACDVVTSGASFAAPDGWLMRPAAGSPGRVHHDVRAVAAGPVVAGGPPGAVAVRGGERDTRLTWGCACGVAEGARMWHLIQSHQVRTRLR